MSGAVPIVGRVWLVGAGPGDPELLTIRGRRVLETADIVLHDRLIPEAIVDLIPSGVLRIDVGKLGYARSISQARINTLLVGFAEAGYRVARLKGGDPFVFGRGGEEAAALRAAGIPFEIVPGVTAGVAGPAFAGIPVTHRGVARSVAFVTAQLGESQSVEPGSGVDWDAMARIDTVVVFMAGRNAAEVGRRLTGAGRAATTPAALIVDASLPSQSVWLGDLSRLSTDAPSIAPGRACLLVVGEVVSLAPELAWFEPALAGLGVPSA